MDAQERRQAIAHKLERAEGPVSASTLAREFSVSRQIIVGDVALLRAGGLDIAATPRGYVMPAQSAGLVRTLACRHRGDQMEAELNAVVDQGCTVVDVIVEHPIYGQLTGPLRLSNRYEVGQFIQRCREESAAPLSLLTEGIHLHTISCPGPEARNAGLSVAHRQVILYLHCIELYCIYLKKMVRKGKRASVEETLTGQTMGVLFIYFSM